MVVFFSSGELCSFCFITLRLQCKSQSYPLLLLVILFFRCRIEKESLSWAFPNHSPTHTIFHRHVSSLTYKQDTHAFLTYGLSLFLEMLFTLHAWRDFSVEVVPGCLSFTHYMFQKTRLESYASECST